MKTSPLGQLLDRRYRVIRPLAAGGFGQTYIAEDTRRPGNPCCVVKHLKPASSDLRFLENARRLFVTEAESLEKLGHHPQIPRLLAYFEEGEEFFLVQEWIEGHPLIQELQPGRRWPETHICQMLWDVLNILVFVHHHQVIHRDIKPDNLIRRVADGQLVLVDFGTVKQIRTQMILRGQATETIAVGTPGYMPTEQSHGKPRPNSDLYALGMIGIQAATGWSPTQIPEDAETGEIVWQDQAQVSLELAHLLSQMVRYHFKDRYQSAIATLTDLAPAAIPNSECIKRY
ncbi:MAG: serine/threonine protein kinase [Oculatellaceae cyanobacterium Prado106]|jgi:serine/threonine-protein kinase|nr:serine/threonine protein kinase [Oculatellaceae cyanobacterium Prado106]